MNVLLPQPIETEAISLLEKKHCRVTTAPDPKPETVVPLLKDAHALILRTGITISRELIENYETI
jgi:phosphoglycerate dehydrogenase-like enzyme